MAYTARLVLCYLLQIALIIPSFGPKNSCANSIDTLIADDAKVANLSAHFVSEKQTIKHKDLGHFQTHFEMHSLEITEENFSTYQQTVEKEFSTQNGRVWLVQIGVEGESVGHVHSSDLNRSASAIKLIERGTLTFKNIKDDYRSKLNFSKDVVKKAGKGLLNFHNSYSRFTSTAIRIFANGGMVGTIYMLSNVLSPVGSFSLGLLIGSMSGLVHFNFKQFYAWIRKSGQTANLIDGFLARFKKIDRRKKNTPGKIVEEHLRWLFTQVTFVSLSMLLLAAFGVEPAPTVAAQAYRMVLATLMSWVSQAPWDLHIDKERELRKQVDPTNAKKIDFYASNKFLTASVLANAIAKTALIANHIGIPVHFIGAGLMGVSGLVKLIKTEKSMEQNCQKTLMVNEELIAPETEQPSKLTNKD